MSAMDTEPFPRGALIAAGAMVGFSLVATGAARLLHMGEAPAAFIMSRPAPARTADLKFVDQSDGSVGVLDSRGGERVAILAPGTNGFVRGVMRGLAHDRKVRHIGDAMPFRLSEWSDGRLALEDTATGRMIDLDAFGVSNKDAFARLIPGRGAPS